MKEIFIFLAFLAAAVHADGIMSFGITASKSVVMNLEVAGYTKFNFHTSQNTPRHFAFRPSQSSNDEYFSIKLGLNGSNEIPRDVILHLIPGHVEKVMDFGNVNVTIRSNYICDDHFIGLKCDLKETTRNPTTIGTVALTTTSTVETVSETKDESAYLKAILEIIYLMAAVALIIFFILHLLNPSLTIHCINTLLLSFWTLVSFCSARFREPSQNEQPVVLVNLPDNSENAQDEELSNHVLISVAEGSVV